MKYGGEDVHYCISAVERREGKGECTYLTCGGGVRVGEDQPSENNEGSLMSAPYSYYSGWVVRGDGKRLGALE